MRHSITVLALATLLATTASAQTTDPKKPKGQITGDAKGAASVNPHCKLFTEAEIATCAGAPVGPGANAASGMGCNWHDKTYSATVTVSVVPASYFPVPDGVKCFKRMSEPGTKAWVAPDSGWSAGATVQDMAVVVVVSGKTSTEASAVDVLKEAIKRRKS